MKSSFVARILAVSITIVVSGLGLTAILGEYAPPRSTRFGFVGALYGEYASKFGVIIFFVGLVPLLLFCKTQKQAAYCGTILFLMIMVALFGSLYLD